jgi:hypothetical protein
MHAIDGTKRAGSKHGECFARIASNNIVQSMFGQIAIVILGKAFPDPSICCGLSSSFRLLFKWVCGDCGDVEHSFGLMLPRAVPILAGVISLVEDITVYLTSGAVVASNLCHFRPVCASPAHILPESVCEDVSNLYIQECHRGLHPQSALYQYPRPRREYRNTARRKN